MRTLAFVPLSPLGHIFGSNLLIICTSLKRCSLFPVFPEPGVVSTLFAVGFPSTNGFGLFGLVDVGVEAEEGVVDEADLETTLDCCWIGSCDLFARWAKHRLHDFKEVIDDEVLALFVAEELACAIDEDVTADEKLLDKILNEMLALLLSFVADRQRCSGLEDDDDAGGLRELPAIARYEVEAIGAILLPDSKHDSEPCNRGMIAVSCYSFDAEMQS
jgi:hypothetical protein